MNTGNNIPTQESQDGKENKKEVPGEAMRDSMSETAPNNDNTKIPEAEKSTDSQGRLDAEKFKSSYENRDDQKTGGQ